jgi:hypothetical protein
MTFASIGRPPRPATINSSGRSRIMDDNPTIDAARHGVLSWVDLSTPDVGAARIMSTVNRTTCRSTSLGCCSAARAMAASMALPCSVSWYHGPRVSTPGTSRSPSRRNSAPSRLGG